MSEGREIQPALKYGVSVALRYNGIDVLEDTDEMVCLTDMWKANGKLANKDPGQWSRLPQSIAFIDTVSRNLNLGKSQVWKTRRGKHLSGTWAHWQVGLAYAEYLNPEFHVAVHDVFRRHIQGLDTSSSPQWEVVSSSQTDQLLHMARGLVGVLEVQKAQEVKLNTIEFQVDEQSRELARLKHEREVAEAKHAEIEAEAKARLRAIEEQSRSAIDRADEAKAVANRAMRTVTSEPGWYCLVPWAVVHGIHLPPGNKEGQDAWEGKRLAAICRDHGIEPKKHATERYALNRKTMRGGVNSAPEDMLELWREDYLGRFPFEIGASK